MKNHIYEIFGFKPNDNSKLALKYKKNCICPFTEIICDGGGNRYQTFIKPITLKSTSLENYFNKSLKLIPPGVCSIKTNEDIWIVCPRRVFSISEVKSNSQLRHFSHSILSKYLKLSENKVGVWPEVKVKYNESSEDENIDDEKSFDYTFDFIICAVGPKQLSDIAEEIEESENKLEKKLIANGYTLALRDGVKYLEEYPLGVPHIIEVMTSSTSGGNKEKETTIQDSFKKAILNGIHESPGINYRQVWARMVSQLIVKSQIGHKWGGSTLWILQDSLTKYISRTTDLNLNKLISTVMNEVNILSVKLLEEQDELGCYKIVENALYAGNIPKIESDTDFNKLLQAASIPLVKDVKKRLLHKKPKTFINI